MFVRSSPDRDLILIILFGQFKLLSIQLSVIFLMATKMHQTSFWTSSEKNSLKFWEISKKKMKNNHCILIIACHCGFSWWKGSFQVKKTLIYWMVQNLSKQSEDNKTSLLLLRTVNRVFNHWCHLLYLLPQLFYDIFKQERPKFGTGCIKDLDKHNLVKMCNGGLDLGNIHYCPSKIDARLNSDQNWHEINHLALLV